MTIEASVDSADQDQTAQNVQSDLIPTLFRFSFYTIKELFFQSSCNGSGLLADQKLQFIYLIVKKLQVAQMVTTLPDDKILGLPK